MGPRPDWRPLHLVALLFPLLFLLAGSALGADEQPPAPFRRYVQHGGYLLAGPQGELAAFQADQPFIPASILKIATALTALDLLGPESRFETDFIVDQDHHLYIRGHGDPLMISEEVMSIMTRLRDLGITRINDLVFDLGAFALQGPAAGVGNSPNPYDASNGALVVNFNTLPLLVAADRTVSSPEPQTPTLPIMGRHAAGLTPGRHRINLAHDRAEAVQYAGELFRALQHAAAIPGTGVIREGVPPQGATTFYRHHSSLNLTQVLEKMLLYSTNFIANQLYLACAAKKLGEPVTWDMARSVMGDHLAQRPGTRIKNLQLTEGSGISPANRLSPRTMLAILEAFKPFARLLPTDDRGRLVKTGTLTGVYSLAGYLQREGRLYPFVIMLNQPRNTRLEVLELLEKKLPGSTAGP